MSRGDLLSFLCAVVFALHIVVVSHYSPMMGFETIAVIQVRYGGGAGDRVVPLFGAGAFSRDAGSGGGGADYGCAGYGAGFYAMAWAQQYTSASRAALIFRAGAGGRLADFVGPDRRSDVGTR